jgi:hypothetical protein
MANAMEYHYSQKRTAGLPVKVMKACFAKTSTGLPVAVGPFLILILVLSAVETRAGELAMQAWVQRYSHPGGIPTIVSKRW